MSDILDLFKTRRSIRTFLSEPVSDEVIQKVLEAGRWAPSGLNNQPWRFIIVKDAGMKQDIANCTKYIKIIQNAPVIIVVFFDQEKGYNRTKDMQAMGACIQNMLLAIHALNLGGVWLGEILNQKAQVEKLLNVPKTLELQAVIALGHPVQEKIPKSGSRKPLEQMRWFEKYD